MSSVQQQLLQEGQQGIQDLLKIIQEEQKLYTIRRNQHLHDVNSLLEKTPSNHNQLVDEVAVKSNYKIQEFKEIAIHVESQVQSLQVQANKAMQSFESLKNRKQNIDKVLNSLTAFNELRRVKSELPGSIQNKDINSCLKLAQAFISIENLLLIDFCQKDYREVKKLIEVDLVQLQKVSFEEALKQNDLVQINLCACLAKVLKQESEHSLERVQNVHGKELRKKLLLLEEQMFEKVNSNYEEYVHKLQTELQEGPQEYDFPFLWHFVKILEKVNEQAERFADNITSFYGQEGLNQLLIYLMEDVSNPFLSGVIKRLTTFFEIEKDQKKQTKRANSPPQATQLAQQSQKPTLLTALQYQETQIDQVQLQKISLYCQEVATISGQLNEFHLHVSSFGKKDKDKEREKDSLQGINPTFSKLSINSVIVDLLGQFLQQVKKETYWQLLSLFQKEESLQVLWNFDKTKIVPLTDSQEQLLGNGFHEWLEEVFYTVKHSINLAISSGNQMIASALINYVNSEIIAEDLYQVVTQLINRYLKKEYFSTSSIGINSKYSVHNAFIILLFNILSNIPKYLRTLKSQLYNELQTSGQHSYQQNQMIVGAIEEMVDTNQKKFTHLIQDKMKILAENLKLTVKPLFDQVKSLNFSINENVIVEQEREYTKLFSQQFKSVLGPGLEQWRHQLSNENYESLSIQLCSSLAKTLEQLVVTKQYNQMGAIVLEKEIRSIINFFSQSTNANVKQCFLRLQMICETLMLESHNDMEEFLSNSAIGELTVSEFKKIGSLRIDLVKDLKGKQIIN